MVVESDKADMDVESFSEGILGAIVIPEGGVATVGAAIAYIAESEADLDAAKQKAGAAGGWGLGGREGGDVEAGAHKWVVLQAGKRASARLFSRLCSCAAGRGHRLKGGRALMNLVSPVQVPPATVPPRLPRPRLRLRLLLPPRPLLPRRPPPLPRLLRPVRGCVFCCRSRSSQCFGPPAAPRYLAPPPLEARFASSWVSCISMVYQQSLRQGRPLLTQPRPSPPAAAAAPAPAAPPAPAAAPRADGRVIATPYAKKLAKDLGVDLATVAGTGPAGRITAADVEAAKAGRGAAAAPAPAAPAPAAAPAPGERRMGGLRRFPQLQQQHAAGTQQDGAMPSPAGQSGMRPGRRRCTCRKCRISASQLLPCGLTASAHYDGPLPDCRSCRARGRGRARPRGGPRPCRQDDSVGAARHHHALQHAAGGSGAQHD